LRKSPSGERNLTMLRGDRAAAMTARYLNVAQTG
jgi:hypothetical protein